ncbi:winged helix-turn-helix transcriptional regulator [Roseivirga sp.]|uniref:winged helix-turn-helix transcriptional regulator n=1 Tax=Roseivirga sp. TaxID=1964215 RepID=UPI003B8AA796
MNQEFRCDCPVTSAIDILGDKWVLIIIKQMLIERMETFKDFTDSDEAISTSILTLKLKCLESYGLVERKNHPTNKKTKLYHLTEKGLSLAPVVVDLAIWSDQNLREFNPIMRQTDELEFMKSNREGAINALKKNYKEKLAKTQYTKS